MFINKFYYRPFFLIKKDQKIKAVKKITKILAPRR